MISKYDTMCLVASCLEELEERTTMYRRYKLLGTLEGLLLCLGWLPVGTVFNYLTFPTHDRFGPKTREETYKELIVREATSCMATYIALEYLP